jgi:hypothetical protein
MNMRGSQQHADRQAWELQTNSQLEFLSHRRWRDLPDTALGHTTEGTHLSFLIQRAVAAYKSSSETPYGDGSMWTHYFKEHHLSTHETLMRGDLAEAAAIWENPGRAYPFWGFDDIHENYTAQREHNKNGRKIAAYRAYDNLLQLAAAVGVARTELPEAPLPPFEDIEAILERLDAAIGFRIDFPNPYPLEFGLKTSRGVASYRAIQALYQAYRTKILVSDCGDARILEIGAGLGRSAYYCYRAGIRDYTIIDLPFTGVSQAIHLGVVLGENEIRLQGENSGAPISILAPGDFIDGSSTYDLVVNFDSITEMGGQTQRVYMEQICKRSRAFLSVNHEYNPVTVSALIREFMSDWKTTRYPYWMRRGYVEETVLA